MTVDVPDLAPLFDPDPDAVAVVGASPDSFYSGNLVDNLLDYGFDGALSPVNPSRDEAWGRSCYDAIDDVPETVDLVVVSVPRESVVDVVLAAGERGVPVALVAPPASTGRTTAARNSRPTSPPPRGRRVSAWSGRTVLA